MKRLSLAAKALAAFAAVTILAGCAVLPRVDDQTLVRLYREERAKPKEHPLIFIPGIMGTVLKDKRTGRTVWGTVNNRIISMIALPIDAVAVFANRDNLVSTQIMERFTWVPGLVERQVYENVHRAVVSAGGYVPGETAYPLSYDWRRDFIEAVRGLGTLVDDIKRQHHDPALKVDLLCHSAGGLIARYYVKYGTEDVLSRDVLPEPTYAGAANVNKVIMLGTPNDGSVEAFQRLHEGLNLPTVSFLPPEALFTMPSLYQLMPFDGQAVLVDENGLPLTVNLYDEANWERYGWSVFNPRIRMRTLRQFKNRYGVEKGKAMFEEHLAKERRFLAGVLRRAQAFQQALWKGDIEEEGRRVRYVLLGSDCQPTLRRALLLKKNDGRWQTVFGSRGDSRLQETVYGFGDLSVTKKSLLGVHETLDSDGKKVAVRIPSQYESFACENHQDMAKNPAYLDNVLHVLLDQD